MLKEEIPRGQLSNIILSTLFDNDKYGYEIIDVVKEKTDGKVVIKQPTLYSSLRRMEEQGLISSYWRDSEIGGRRHYYSITDYGKKYAEKWQTDLNEFLLSIKNMPSSNNSNNSNIYKATTVLQQGNLVDMTKNEVKQEDVVKEPANKTFVQYDLFTSPTLISEPSDELFDKVKKLREEADDEYKQTKESDKIEMLSSLRNSNSSTQEDITTNYVAKSYSVNQNIDIKTAFFNLTKNNKSFASAMRDNDVPTISDDNISNQSNIEYTNNNKQENINNSFDNVTETETNESVEKIENKEFNETIYQNTKFDNDDFSFVNLDGSVNLEIQKNEDINNENTVLKTLEESPTHLQEEPKKKDDAVYITSSPEQTNIPKVRKITSERFEQITKNYTSFLDEKLKKEKLNEQDEEQSQIVEENTGLEQSYNDEYVEEAVSQQNQNIKNLYDLEKYYKKINLKFSTYTNNSKTNMQKYVKINWLNCVSFSVITALSIILSIVMFCVLRTSQPSWNFLYLIIPMIFVLIDALYIFKYYKQRNAITLTSNVLRYNWLYQLTLSINTILVLCSVNVLAGLTIDNVSSYLTTLLYTSIMTTLYPLWSLVNYLIIKLSNKK